jgi:hypothetical protein
MDIEIIQERCRSFREKSNLAHKFKGYLLASLDASQCCKSAAAVWSLSEFPPTGIRMLVSLSSRP